MAHLDLRFAWRKELYLEIHCPDLMQGVTQTNYGNRFEKCVARRDRPIDLAKLNRPDVFPMADLIFNNVGLYTGNIDGPAPLRNLEELRDWLIDKHDSIETILGYKLARSTKAKETQLALGRECLRHAVLWFRHFTGEELSIRTSQMTSAEKLFDGFAQAIERVKAATLEVQLASTTPSGRSRKGVVGKSIGRPVDTSEIHGRSRGEWLDLWLASKANPPAHDGNWTVRRFLAWKGLPHGQILEAETAISSEQRRRRRQLGG
jgi:hypothetical protein